MPGTTRSNRSPDRAATEAALERAALALLERNGALSGLNLREVADEAGVNRGLVYHYFGSRRDLLRAALRTDVKERMRDLRAGHWRPLPERYARFLPTMLRHRRAVILAALLILDGDEHVRMVPDHDQVMEHYERDTDGGWIDDELDLDAVHVALVSLVYGYMVFRDRFAEELDHDPDHLDKEMGRVFTRMMAGLAADFDGETTPVSFESDPPAD